MIDLYKYRAAYVELISWHEDDKTLKIELTDIKGRLCTLAISPTTGYDISVDEIIDHG
jgi:hypothetical protein